MWLPIPTVPLPTSYPIRPPASDSQRHYAQWGKITAQDKMYGLRKYFHDFFPERNIVYHWSITEFVWMLRAVQCVQMDFLLQRLHWTFILKHHGGVDLPHGDGCPLTPGKQRSIPGKAFAMLTHLLQILRRFTTMES